MSGTYWYEKHPELLDAEKQAMARHFPSFKLDRLSDGRLYWVGNVNPRGEAGGVWTLQAIYDHDHPNNKHSFGSSVRVYSIVPDLNDLARAIGGQLPHVLQDSAGNLYLCTSRKQDVSAGYRDGGKSGKITSAASSIAWGLKWIWIVEGWLAGEISNDEAFGHTF